MKKCNVLDCTLRDGGYYNRWDFEPEVVQAYLDSMTGSKIDYVELGLRSFAQKGFRGGFAYTTECFINGLNLPEGPTYGVMVDAKTILSAGLSISEAIDRLFVDCEDSKIDLVRIAAHFHEVEKSASIVKALKRKGYKVGYNLMQAGGKPTELISKKAEIVSEWEGLDVLYFADSLGNMDCDEVNRIVLALRVYWSGDLGIHTHNNMGKALANCLAARSAGVNWLDVTVTGMGRGAGNAQTENLLAVFAQETSNYFAPPVYDLVIRYFEPMQKKYGWGSNLLYFLGAQYNIHPTYIQNLLSDSHFGTNEIIGAINYLSLQNNRSSYDDDVYRVALTFSEERAEVSGSPALSGIAFDKEVLILANGPSLHRYLASLKSYTSIRKPIVVAINLIEESPVEIDYYCISHNNKFLVEHGKYHFLRKPVILPKHRFSEKELHYFDESCELIDYGMSVRESCFEVGKESCVVPFDITAAYAFAIAETMGASKVTLVGFDGYDSSDSRQLEMIETISLLKKLTSIKSLVALTPTTYPLDQGSVYAPV